VAYVPQDPVLPDDMTGFEYVLLGRAPYVGYFGSETRHDRAMVATCSSGSTSRSSRSADSAR
jgi:ABC-type cobalamin/Fe3+-siderophores transport system ATPase subunit